MNKQRLLPDAKITESEIQSSLLRAGYFLEGQVKEAFQKAGFGTYSNTTFIDEQSGKIRELDIEASILSRIFKDKRSYFGYFIACECKTRRQPLVLFKDRNQSQAQNELEICFSGHPKSLQGEPAIDLTDIFEYHRYFKSEICFQYCSFRQNSDKTEWVAEHDEQDYTSLRSIVQGLKQRLKEIDHRLKKVPIHYRIGYPMLVLNGDIYLANENSGSVTLESVDHAILRIEDNVVSNDTSDISVRTPYYVDIVKYSYLDTFIKVLDTEFEKIKQALIEKRAQIMVEIADGRDL